MQEEIVQIGSNTANARAVPRLIGVAHAAMVYGDYPKLFRELGNVVSKVAADRSIGPGRHSGPTKCCAPEHVRIPRMAAGSALGRAAWGQRDIGLSI